MSAKLSVRRLVSVVGALVVSVTTLTVAQQPPPAPPPAPLPSAALFNDAVVQRIDLRMHSSDWEKLKENFQENTYYPADLVWNGQTVANSGIRSRGLGSRSGTKPGLRVDFDRYATDRTFLGLKSIILDNLAQDASAIHETVTMKLFARLGIPAPREAHARLYVDNKYVGLYAIVESIDKQFLARAFGSIGGDTQNDGYLYEFDYIDPWTFSYLGSKLEAYAARFKSKTHDKKSMAERFGPIENLVRLVNELPAEQFLSGLDQHLDLTALMRYVAAQTFVAQNDGFLGYAGMNNFYFYRLENSTRHVFLAWDEDNAFWGHDYAIDTRHEENVLMRKAMQVSELRGTYYGMLNEAMASADEPTGPAKISWLELEIRRQSELIYDALREDPFKPYSLEAHDNARTAMIEFAQQRSRHLREQLTVR
ncbi:MAG TPA: CotH kinase family protein [Vicinamibacterales bacterium]|nr:CotH kinase family protein [Vicinamibacterales bacterium]